MSLPAPERSNPPQGQRAAVIAAVMLAIGGGATIGAGIIPKWEGKRNVGYADRLAGNLPTACYGNTSKAVVGKYYTDAACDALLTDDAVRHGLEIARCLPQTLPLETRAAFTSIGFNIGSSAFCRSSMSKRAKAGNLPGACAAISLYTYAGGKDCKDPKNRCGGLPARRAEERALCEGGLT